MSPLDPRPQRKQRAEICVALQWPQQRFTTTRDSMPKSLAQHRATAPGKLQQHLLPAFEWQIGKGLDTGCRVSEARQAFAPLNGVMVVSTLFCAPMMCTEPVSDMK